MGRIIKKTDGPSCGKILSVGVFFLKRKTRVDFSSNFAIRTRLESIYPWLLVEWAGSSARPYRLWEFAGNL